MLNVNGITQEQAIQTEINGLLDEVAIVNDANTSTGSGALELYTCTAAEYAAIAVKDTSTLYYVI